MIIRLRKHSVRSLVPFTDFCNKPLIVRKQILYLSYEKQAKLKKQREKIKIHIDGNERMELSVIAGDIIPFAGTLPGVLPVLPL